MIYLVRHGQTEFNVARRYQGRQDSPLTPKGELQARRMGERLAALVGDGADWRFVTSPLGRALRTAEIIRRHLPGAPEPEVDPRLAEVGMGEWDGLTHEQLEARRPAAVDYGERWFHGPGGETYEAFTGRVRNWLDSIRPDEQVIAVSHGVVTRVLRGLYVGMAKPKMLRLDAPQDVVFRLDEGRVRRFDCEPVG